MSDATIDEVCAIACAEAWRGDGETLASPAGGIIPSVGAALAKLTFEPDLLLTDGESGLLAKPIPLGGAASERVVEGYLTYRSVFDVVWSGRRHVMMGGSQLDAYGNHNFAAIGDMARPKAQLLGFRGAPGNTVNNATSYWIPRHGPRVFVERVDVVTGVGFDRAKAAGRAARRFHAPRHVITNLAVLDFDTPDHRMRLRSLHPGVTVDDVTAATGFDLVVPEEVSTTREPTAEELATLERIDPAGERYAEVPDA
jgi:acyl CoA:acetate/3-ketoacid CoA transferase beta subunit